MANTFLSASLISSTAVGLLTRNLLLPMTVTRESGLNFSGATGDTVNIRVRAKIAARTQATPGAAITYDDVTEETVPLQVGHLYNATKIPDEAMTWSIENFGVQILEPQMAGIAEGAENAVATVMNTLTNDASTVVTDSATAKAGVLEARETLTRASVPLGDRYLAVSPEFGTHLFGVDEFVRYDAREDGSALQTGTLGRILGFTVVETPALDAGEAVAYHRSAFAFASFAPVVPAGVPTGSQAQYGGIGMRWVRDYDPDVLSDRSVVSTFAGAAGIETGTRAFKFAAA